MGARNGCGASYLHTVKQLGLRGAAVGATVADDEFADPKFQPFWAKAEDPGVMIFLHPQGACVFARRLGGNGWLVNTIGNPLDTTIALSNLIFEGTLDRFPGLKLCSDHGGGYLPSYAARSDYAPSRSSEDGHGRAVAEAADGILARAVLRHARFHVRGAAAPGRRSGCQPVDAWHRSPVSRAASPGRPLLQAAGFTDDERIAMLGVNAGTLLGIAAD